MAGRRQKRIHQLDLQLEAILDAMIKASQEPDPERRAEKLAVVERAFTAYHKAHLDALARPTLRVLPGGAAVVAAAIAAGSWLRGMVRAHPQVAVGTVAAAAAATVGLVLVGPWRGQTDEGQGPSASAPTSTAPPSSSVPSPSPSRSAPSSPPPASSPAPSASPGPSVVPTLSQGPPPPASGETEPGSTASVEPPVSRPGPGGTTPEVPPDEDDEPPGDGDDDAEMEGPAPPVREQCLVDIDLPLVDVHLGGVLCA